MQRRHRGWAASWLMRSRHEREPSTVAAPLQDRQGSYQLSPRGGFPYDREQRRVCFLQLWRGWVSAVQTKGGDKAICAQLGWLWGELREKGWGDYLGGRKRLWIDLKLRLSVWSTALLNGWDEHCSRFPPDRPSHRLHQSVSVMMKEQRRPWRGPYYPRYHRCANRRSVGGASRFREAS